MSDLNDRLHQEAENLRQLRDELRVQLHLGAAEAREVWEGAEKKLEHLEGKLKVLRDQASESAHDVAEAAKLLLSEIADAYKHLKQLL